MGFGSEQLRDKALLALEEVVQECRYRAPRRSFAVRFALAYLWAYSAADRAPFDRLWRDLGVAKTPWSFTGADMALGDIYRLLGVRRDESIGTALWRQRQAEERDS